MWYLQADTLLLLLGFSLAAALARRFLPKGACDLLLPLCELAALWYIDPALCLFYALYSLLGLGCARWLGAAERGKKVLFPALCLAALIPLFLARAQVFGVTLPFAAVSVGVAFQLLKLIDVFYYVYYARLPVEPLPFLNYMLFLPVFTAGPIFRYRDFLRTYASPLPLTGALAEASLKRAIRGLFKKVVLLLPVSWALEQLLEREYRWYVTLALAAVSCVYLYLDLSGYSDIAIALGRLAGYDVPENFKRPFACPSLTQFWRSWHATLSDYIREHVYIPLSVHRPGRAASAAVAFLVMVLMSLWHGFYLSYLAAGVYNGALLALETALGLTTVNRRKTKRAVLLLRCAAVDLLFALNTLVFTLPPQSLGPVLGGLLRF